MPTWETKLQQDILLHDSVCPFTQNIAQELEDSMSRAAMKDEKKGARIWKYKHLSDWGLSEQRGAEMKSAPHLSSNETTPKHQLELSQAT